MAPGRRPLCADDAQVRQPAGIVRSANALINPPMRGGNQGFVTLACLTGISGRHACPGICRPRGFPHGPMHTTKEAMQKKHGPKQCLSGDIARSLMPTASQSHACEIQGKTRSAWASRSVPNPVDPMCVKASRFDTQTKVTIRRRQLSPRGNITR